MKVAIQLLRLFQAYFKKYVIGFFLAEEEKQANSFHVTQLMRKK